MKVIGDHIDINTTGKTLVLPTEDAAILPSFNEYVLNPNRLTIAESPFGGLKSGSPDYSVGTVSTASDNIYIRDITGNNESKVLSAGKLNELNYLTVNTSLNSITEEFEIVNTSDVESTAIISIRCPDYYLSKTLSLFVENAYVAQSITVTDASQTTGTKNTIQFSRTLAAGASERWKLILVYDDGAGSTVADLSGNGNNGTIVGGVTKLNGGGLQFDGSTGYVDFGASTALKQTSAFSIEARFIPGPLNSQRDIFRCGYLGGSKLGVVLYTSSTNHMSFAVGNGSVRGVVQASGGYVTPGTEEHTVAVYDGINCKLYRNGVLAGTSVDAVVPVVYSSDSAKLSAGNGVSEYNGTLKTFKYYNTALSADDVSLLYSGSEVSGASVIVIPTVSNMGSTTHQFADSTNTSYGLQNLSKPWIALYDPTSNLIDFYLFTHRPQNLSFKRDETGTIYSLSLYPGAGSVYHGQIPFADLTRDTNSDSVPDCLEAAVNGSITKFLANYSMVI